MTTEISQYEKSETFEKSKFIAKRGGKVAGNARIGAEKELGRPVTTRQNYLPITEKKNKLPDVNIRSTSQIYYCFLIK